MLPIIICSFIIFNAGFRLASILRNLNVEPGPLFTAFFSLHLAINVSVGLDIICKVDLAVAVVVVVLVVDFDLSLMGDDEDGDDD